jgi:hypothetical protein
MSFPDDLSQIIRRISGPSELWSLIGGHKFPFSRRSYFASYFCATLPGQTTGHGAEEDKMSEAKKCGNPACSCIPPNKEAFCSPHCEALKGSVEVVCQCGHPQCAGSKPAVNA